MRDPTNEEIAAILSVLENEEIIQETLLSDARLDAMRKISGLGVPISRKVFMMTALTFDVIGLNDALRNSPAGMSFVTALTQQVIKEHTGGVKSRLKDSIRKKAAKIAKERRRKVMPRRKKRVEKEEIIAILNSSIIGEDDSGPRVPLDSMKKDVREGALYIRSFVEDELHKVSVSSVLLLARQVGVMVVWRTERDSRVCAICAPLEGQVFLPERAPIPVEDTHPNCRCALVPIISSLQ